jgi:tripartite-type tricarboxylate transporter receptor subunit TctC
MKHRLITALAVAAAALVGSPITAGAQANYPSKPIRLIVPEVVGSAADLMSRIIGQRIGEALGQPVTFENLFLEAGVEKGIKSAPDGYTLIYGSSGNLALLPHVKKVSFDPRTDLTPVARFDSQWTMAPIAGRLPHMRTGKLRAIAIATPARSPLLPDVPTVAESGYPGYSAVGWGAIFVPNGTPQGVIDKLNATIATIVTLPEVKKQFEEQGTEAAGSTQAEMAKMLREDYAQFGESAKQIGAAVD